MTRPSTSRRHGVTLIELVLTMTIVACASTAGVYAVHASLDHIATRDAIRSAGALMIRARDEAVALHTLVRVRVDTATATLEVRTRTGTLRRLALGSIHGVELTTTRDSIIFDLRGLGYGAANLTLVARRGNAAETLVVSRLGRVRY